MEAGVVFERFYFSAISLFPGIRYKFSPDLIAVMEREEKKKKKGGADYPVQSFF